MVKVGNISEPIFVAILVQIRDQLTTINKRFESGQNYTSLIATPSLLLKENDLFLKWEVARNLIETVFGVNQRPMTIDYVNLNYMSNIDQSIRQQQSIRFCPNSTRSSVQSGNTLHLMRC